MAEENKKVVQNQEDDKKKKKLGAWWKGLKTPAKVAICAVAGLGVTSAVVFPVLANTVWKKPSEVQGVQVTEDQWKAALTAVCVQDDNMNFKCVNTETQPQSNGEESGTFECKVQGFKLYVESSKTDKGVTTSDKEYEYKNSDNIMVTTTYLNNKNYINNFANLEGSTFIKKHFHDNLKDEIDSYNKYVFDENSKIYIPKSTANGESSSKCQFKFNSDFKLATFKKTSDEKVENYVFSDYGKISVEIPTMYNEVKNFTSSGNVRYSTEAKELLTEKGVSNYYGIYGQVQFDTTIKSVDFKLSNQDGTTTNTELGSVRYYLDNGNPNSKDATSGVCNIATNSNTKITFVAFRTETEGKTTIPYNVHVTLNI